MAARVLKFGGSALTGHGQIEAAASRVEACLRAGISPVVVASALRGITDRLISAARGVHPDPPLEELDRLLATGELQSAAMLSLALAQRGIRSRSYSGAEAGIITDDSFGRARVIEIDSRVLTAALAAGEVPVVAGFQGATRDGRVTTLGRGGGDISAVTLAWALDADRVVFHRDTDGIHSADPKLLASSRRFDRLQYGELVDLAEAGAPLAHPQAIEIARARQIPLEMRGAAVGSGATWICDDPVPHGLPVWSVSVSPPISMLTIDGLPKDLTLLARLLALVDRSDLPSDAQLGPGPSSGQKVCLSVVLPELEAPRIRDQFADYLREEGGIRTTLERSRRRVTLVGKGVSSRRVSRAVDNAALRFGQPMATFWGEKHRAFIVPEAHARGWLSSLHQELIQP